MLRRALGVHLVGLCLLLLPLRASALDWYIDRAAWQSAVGIWADVDLSSYNPYDVISAGTPIPLPYDETLALDLDVEVRQVPTSWIADWTGDPKVLCSPWYSGAITGTFGGGGGGVFGFGVEVEPDIYGIYDVTLDLSDGSSLTQAVEVTPVGEGGDAGFFGWAGGDINWMVIGCTSPYERLGFGRMMKAEAPGPGAIPELPPVALAALGLLPLGLKLRRRK